MIFKDYHTSGDGMISGLQMLQSGLQIVKKRIAVVLVAIDSF